MEDEFTAFELKMLTLVTRQTQTIERLELDIENLKSSFEDVERMIQGAIDDLPESMNENEVERMIENMMEGSDFVDEDKVEKIVNEAIDANLIDTVKEEVEKILQNAKITLDI